MSALQPADLPFVDYEYPAVEAGGPRLALVGEAPGNEEVRQGRPFAGRSGRLLDEGLESVGIERRTCLVANTFRRQPPGNKIGHFFASRTKARRLDLAVAEALGPFGACDYCRADLAHEIEALATALARVAAPVIVALGRTPLWALTGLAGITRLRGQVLPCRLVPGAVVVPTYHPSYLLRGNLIATPLFLADLERALAELALRQPAHAAAG